MSIMDGNIVLKYWLLTFPTGRNALIDIYPKPNQSSAFKCKTWLETQTDRVWCIIVSFQKLQKVHGITVYSLQLDF